MNGIPYIILKYQYVSFNGQVITYTLGVDSNCKAVSNTAILLSDFNTVNPKVYYRFNDILMCELRVKSI